MNNVLLQADSQRKNSQMFGCAGQETGVPAPLIYIPFKLGFIQSIKIKGTPTFHGIRRHGVGSCTTFPINIVVHASRRGRHDHAFTRRNIHSVPFAERTSNTCLHGIRVPSRQRFQFIHVDDVPRIQLGLINYKHAPKSQAHVGSSTNNNQLELYHNLLRKVGVFGRSPADTGCYQCSPAGYSVSC